MYFYGKMLAKFGNTGQVDHPGRFIHAYTHFIYNLNEHEMIMKRLIVCCDGTWQELRSSYPTNVIKIAQAVKSVGDDAVSQIVFYDEGIGTESQFNRFVGGAFGRGIDKNIMDCYRFIVLNYEVGDELYLFGFSRGAYTVRSLAGLLYNSGLPKRQYIRKIPEAYELYRDREVHPASREAGRFRESFCQSVDVTLLGCWDTVGSLGVPNQIAFLPIDDWINEKYQFHDIKLSPIVSHALHAVAIDERREVFDVTLMIKSSAATDQTLTQVWFVGDHGCVGGGSKKKSSLSDIALNWMLNEISDRGLRLSFDPRKITSGIAEDHKADFDNRVCGIYHFTGAKPRNVEGSFSDLHESVKKRWHDLSNYRPKNLQKFEAEFTAWQK